MEARPRGHVDSEPGIGQPHAEHMGARTRNSVR